LTAKKPGSAVLEYMKKLMCHNKYQNAARWFAAVGQVSSSSVYAR